LHPDNIAGRGVLPLGIILGLGREFGQPSLGDPAEDRIVALGPLVERGDARLFVSGRRRRARRAHGRRRPFSFSLTSHFAHHP
jgi:hypothetical protein